MLPSAHRLLRASDFQRAIRTGRRASSRLVVVHAAGPASVPTDADELPARVGFVVSKAIGSAVVRNRVKRQLRHLMSSRLEIVGRGTLLVVRANPAAATTSSGRLGRDLDRCLARVEDGT